MDNLDECACWRARPRQVAGALLFTAATGLISGCAHSIRDIPAGFPSAVSTRQLVTSATPPPSSINARPTLASTESAVHDAFLDCNDIVPGAPSCSGGPSLVDGWIAFVAQKAPDTLPEVAQVVQIDGEGAWWPPGARRVR